LLPCHSNLDNYYKSIGKVFYWHDEDKTISNSKMDFLYKIKNKFFLSARWKEKLIEKFSKENYDIIYGNTIVVINTLKSLKSLNKPIVWHIHENELSVNIYNKNSLNSFKIAKIIISTSQYTHDYLKNKWNIPTNQIKIHLPPISKNTEQYNITKLPENCFIIGSSGTSLTQKGMSIFVILAKILETKFENNNFFYVWIGSELDDANIRFDLEQTKLISKFYFTGIISNPYNYYNKFDLFVSCSREESFGLSIAECATLNIPFLCFPTNGLLNYFENKHDFSVNYLDLNEMADRIIELYTNKTKRTDLGLFAGEVCRKFDIDYLGDDWYTTLKNIIK
jgi:hypothetical protein